MKLTIFLLLPVSAQNTIIQISVVPETFEKFSFNEHKLKIEKLKFFTQKKIQVKFFALVFLMVEVACGLTFRPFLTIDLYQLGCL